MRAFRLFAVLGAAALVFGLVPVLSASAGGAGDVLVSNGSPSGPFARNKQNEPALAVDARHPSVLAAGSNDEIDLEACNAGPDNDCPFTPGISVSGIYFSFNSGGSWTQPTYSGWSARNASCTGVVGDDAGCVPAVGPIGTVPNYYENGLVADGDPALAFGPVPDSNGNFSWSNGSRLYYANLTSNFPGQKTFKGPEGVAVARIDGPSSTGLTSAIVSNQANWMAPVMASRQNSALFSDKEQVWADNARSSDFFGGVYVCYAAFRGDPGGDHSQPLMVASSHDGGSTWFNAQVTPATNNIHSKNGFGHSGCTVRTDSQGVVYVFAEQFAFGFPGHGWLLMMKSFDGGASWTNPVRIEPATDTCNAFEPSIGRCVEDGIGGARDDLGPAPSVDISNGAPFGTDATDEIALTWVDGRDGLNNEHVEFTYSTDGGDSWADLAEVEQSGDRGYYAAPAISPDGTDVYLVYNAFTTPFRDDTTSVRNLVGVVLHADVAGDGTVGSFSELHRGADGDPRGSSQNGLQAEFLGDYVYAVATRGYGSAVWNDARDAGVCDDINTYRQDLHDFAVGDTTTAPTRPPVQSVCPFTFGNSDIYGGSFADPS